MNKNIITKFVAMAGVALMALSCQTDYFNEHYLPGYNNDGTITDVQEASITLTDDDYAAIAKNSTNVALAQAEGEEATAALAAIGKNKYFATQDEVAAYMPAFIGAKYPVWDDGSLVLATYTLALDIPEDVMLMNAATEYTLTEDDYKTIWESEEDYAKALTPKTINKLKSVIPVADDAREGDYVVVTYNYSDEEPATETPETPDTPDTPEQPETPAYTSVLATAAVGDVIEVKGYVSAMSTQGPVITDNSGSILLYKYTDLAIGDEVTVNGTVAAYNFGLQFDYSKGGVTVEKTGSTTVTYPTPMDITGEKADELLTSRQEDELCHFAKMHGVLSISTNSDGTKTYYNFNIDGAKTAVGSLYNPTEEILAQLTNDTEYTLYGYFTSISKSGGAAKYINMIVTSVEPAAVPSRLALTVKSEKRYAYFRYNGTGYETANVVAIQPADYTAMGQNYGNFTNPDQDYYIPTFLNNTYPYAEVDDKMYVAYRCYANSATTWKVDEYVFDGAWSKTIYFTEKTDQFRKGEGKWNIDRTLELNYSNTSSPDTRAFYQYCVNWVYDFKDVPMGAPARDNEGVIITTDIVMIDGQKPAGNYWVSNYGNNEFYTGASAYYGNIDWRPSAVKGGFTAAGMGDLSDDEILAKLKEHSAEVFAEVLSYMFPEMTPDEYKKVVIVVYAYGPNANYSFTFDVVETGKFAYVADSITEL